MASQLRPGFKIERLGPPIVNEETGAVRSFGLVNALVKDYSQANFEIANEYVCSRLAIGLGLPTPPGDFAEVRDSDRLYWVSPQVKFESPPPADVQALCAREPSTAAGIRVFDTLVGNIDRHDDNLIYSPRYGVWMIDHGCSLYFRGNSAEEDLPRMVASGIGEHIFDSYLDNRHIDAWCAHVVALPKRTIAGAVAPLVRLDLVTRAHADAVVRYVEERARRIRSLVYDEPVVPGRQEQASIFDTTDGGGY